LLFFLIFFVINKVICNKLVFIDEIRQRMMLTYLCIMFAES